MPLKLTPRNVTVQPDTNPLPLRVRVCEEFDPVAGFGLTLVIVGPEEIIVKLAALDVPPPGLGLYTVTCAVPPEAMSEARILACKLVTSPPPLTVGVVVRFAPFHLTTDDDVNVLPLTVRVNADPPAVALLGLSEVITGNGAFTLKLY